MSLMDYVGNINGRSFFLHPPVSFRGSSSIAILTNELPKEMNDKLALKELEGELFH